jgi:hypothetical protein
MSATAIFAMSSMSIGASRLAPIGRPSARSAGSTPVSVPGR